MKVKTFTAFSKMDTSKPVETRSTVDNIQQVKTFILEQTTAQTTPFGMNITTPLIV